MTLTQHAKQEGYKVTCPDLKHCWIDGGECAYQRYLVENENDLFTFLGHENFKHWRRVQGLFLDTLLGYLAKGLKLLISDNTLSGFPSYHTDRGITILEIIEGE